MMRYGDRHGTARTLSDREVALLLKTSGEHRKGFRDHVLFSLVLGTALREFEAQALNFGDLFTDRGVRRVVALRIFKGSDATDGKKREKPEVRLGDGLRSKLSRLRVNMKKNSLPVGHDDPVFVSNRKTRISLRMIRVTFKRWQRDAGFEREFTFHELRHTAITTAYRRGGKDIELARRFARHSHIGTTQRYTHASDEALDALAGLMPS